MTQASFNYMGRYFRFLVGKLKTCLIFASIFSLFIFPVYRLALSSGSEIAALSSVLMLISIGGLFAVSFITPLLAMKHLFARAVSDNILSLPLTAARRYFCELGASLFCCAAPFALISLPAVLIVGDAAEAEMLCAALLRSVLAVIMVECFQVVLATLCGRIIEAILYPIALHMLIPLFVLVFSYLGIVGLYGGEFGFESDFWRHSWAVQSFLSPLGNILSVNMLWIGDLLPTLGAVVFIAVTIPLGLLFYQKRPAENIGRPFVYRKAYLITSLSVAFVGVVCYFAILHFYERGQSRSSDKLGHLFALSPVEFPVLAVLLLILLLLMEIVNNRRIVSVPKFILKYIGVFAAGTLVSLALYESEGFGRSFYIPSAEETVFISVSGTARAEDASFFSEVTAWVEGDGELSDYIRSVHKELMEARPTDGDSLSLQYALKDGSVVRRYYSGTPEEFCQTILESEAYKYSGLNFFETAGTDFIQYESMTNRMIWSERTRDDRIAVRLILPDATDNDVELRPDGSVFRGFNYEEFRAALTADLANDKNYGRHTELPLGVLCLGEIVIQTENSVESEVYVKSSYGYTLYESYENTIRFLRQYGEIPTAAETAERIAKNVSGYTLSRLPKKPASGSRAASRWYGLASETKDVSLTAEDFLGAFSHTADYTCHSDEYDYVYRISCGHPLSSGENYNDPESRLRYPSFLVNEEYYDVLDVIFADSEERAS